MDQKNIVNNTAVNIGQNNETKKKGKKSENFLDAMVYGVGDVFAGCAKGVGAVGEVAVKGTVAVGKGVVDCVGTVLECAGDICSG